HSEQEYLREERRLAAVYGGSKPHLRDKHDPVLHEEDSLSAIYAEGEDEEGYGLHADASQARRGPSGTSRMTSTTGAARDVDLGEPLLWGKRNPCGRFFAQTYAQAILNLNDAEKSSSDEITKMFRQGDRVNMDKSDKLLEEQKTTSSDVDDDHDRDLRNKLE
ncbi:unnamed protein product, partial [Amoebophrya sp. A25]